MFNIMQLLCGMIVLAMLVAESHGARYHRRYFDDNNEQKLLDFNMQRRLMDRFRLDDDDSDESFYSNKRTAATAPKCTSVKSGTYYGGDTIKWIDNMQTYQDCMNQCENDDNCYGWAYQNSSKSCRVQNSIGWATNDASYMGGSCIGLAAKQTKCQEQLTDTIYNGAAGYVSASTLEACMAKCDAAPTCLGYMFDRTNKYCFTQTAQYGKGAYTGYTAGSCIIPKPAYPPISIDDYRQQALVQHSLYRAKHCTPALTLSDELNTKAQNYAEQLAKNNTFEHSKDKFHGQWMGENLYMSGGSSLLYTLGSPPVTAWYNEIKAYNYSNPGFSMSTGHFTQVVWATTTQLGIGRAVSNDGTKLYVVGNYFPGGNSGAYADNVKRPSC